MSSRRIKSQRTDQTGYDAIIVSDLHLRAGPGDDFLFDEAFNDLVKDVYADGCREIILNGDIFEFVGTWPESEPHPNPALGFTQAESVARMWAIGLQHQIFFEALARFVRDGGRCVFLPGNHDWELHWPKVQVALRHLLGDPPEDRIQFVLHGKAYRPLEGRLHVEHGHQLVGDQNLFHHPLTPFLDDPQGGARRLEQPIGNWLIRTLVNPLEMHFPFINNVRPFSKINWLHPNKHALRALLVMPRAITGVVKDKRIPERMMDIVLSSPPLRPIFGVGRALWNKHRPEFVPSDLAGILGDDAVEPLRQAARRHLQLRRETRYVVLGHSHERVGTDHHVNKHFARHGRGYLNPGCWNPCRELPRDAPPLSLEDLITGAHYPYTLAFVRVRAGRRRALEARQEVYQEGEVWMKAA